MKNLGFILLACLIIAGCKKKDETPVADTGLIGTWDLVAGRGSDGSTWTWYDVPPADSHYIRFIDSTQVETNRYNQQCIGTYQLAADSLMTINYPCLPDLMWKLYLIEKTPTTLIFLDKVPDEGLAYKFKKRS